MPTHEVRRCWAAPTVAGEGTSDDCVGSLSLTSNVTNVPLNRFNFQTTPSTPPTFLFLLSRRTPTLVCDAQRVQRTVRVGNVQTATELRGS